MPVDYTEIAEGALITAAGVTDSFQAIRTEVNSLDEEAIEKNTLHIEHLPSAVLSAGTTGRSGSDITRSDIFDRYPGWNSVSGWGSTGLETTVQNIQLSRAKTAGILVLANMNLKKIDAVFSGTTAWHPNYMAAFAIQFRSGGTWVHLARTERYLDMDTGDDNDFLAPTPLTNTKYTTQLTGKDVAIRTLIRNADNPSGGLVDGVRLVASIHSTGYSATATSYCNIVLRQGNISAIALQGEEIS